MWTCSEAEWVSEGKVTKSCGLDVKDGGGFRVRQESYIRFMMAKRVVEGASKIPKVDIPTDDEVEPELGARHTRAEVAYASAVMSQFVVKAPSLGGIPQAWCPIEVKCLIW